MANRVVEQLDEKIRQLEAWLTGLRAFRAMVGEDPSFVALLQDLLLNPESNGVLNPDRAAAARNPELPTHERIKDYIKATGNKWHSIRQIADGTQISRNTVRGILYQSVHSELFESKKTSNSRTLWRVKVKDGEPVPTFSEDEPEAPPKATVPFGIGEKKTKQPTPEAGPTRPKPKWARS